MLLGQTVARAQSGRLATKLAEQMPIDPPPEIE